MGREAWQATVHAVAKSRTGLSDFTFDSPWEELTLPSPDFGLQASGMVRQRFVVVLPPSLWHFVTAGLAN